jgi:ABC-type maltose transport system permease subunit
MATSSIILLILTILHVAMAGYAIIRIRRTSLFTARQKLLNILLAIVIPYLWSTLMYYMLKKEPVIFDEDKQHKPTSHHFYESGRGMYGGH